jgi:Glycosyltransferase family 87
MKIRLPIPTPDRGIAYKNAVRYLALGFVFASRLLMGDGVHAATINTAASDPKYVRDFVEYWAATRLLLTGNNPYGPQELFDLQRSVGWTDSIPLLMWNPPWTLSFILPFGLASFDVAQFLWLLLNIFIVVFCAKQLWFLYGGPPTAYRSAWLVVLTFAPAYLVLILGQIGPLILLGLVGFLHCARDKHWKWAGAFTILVSIKPHLLYLFWIALVLWIIEKRQWQMMIGVAVSGFIAATIPLLFSPSVYTDYIQLNNTTAKWPTPYDWQTPTMGQAARFFFAPEAVWLQFVPSLIGIFWLLLHWHKSKSQWEWIEQLPILIVASLATAPFAWSFDYIVLLPAIIQAASWLSRRPVLLRESPVIIAYVIIMTLYMLVFFWSPNDFWRFWLGPAFVIAYLIFHRQMTVDSTPTPYPLTSSDRPVTS